MSNATIGLLVAVSMGIVARSLPNDEFGSYSLAVSYFLLSALVFEFGFFVPASRLVARSDDKLERARILGGAVVLFVPIAGAYVLTTFGLSFLVDDLFTVEAGEALRTTAPLCFVYSFRLISLQMAQGFGRLHVFSLTAVLGQALFVIALLMLLWGPGDVTVESASLVRAVGLGLGWVVLVLWLRPVFSETRRLTRTLWGEARRWGFQLYIGRVLSLGTYNLDVMMVGAFTNATEAGYYALAAGVATVIGFPIIGLTNALFPRMTRESRLDPTWLSAAYFMGFAGVLIIVAVAEPMITLFFSDRYSPASAFLFPLGCAQAVRGVTWVYHQFLSAQAQGKDLRNAAFILTGSNVLLNFGLIPPFGAAGAAWASLLALLANLAAHIVFYRRRVRELQTVTSAPTDMLVP